MPLPHFVPASGIVGATGTGLVATAETWALVAAAGGMLLLSAALSAGEAALFSLGSDEIASLERQGRRGIFAAKALLNFRDETLTTILVAKYVVNLAFVACLVIAFSHVAPGRPGFSGAVGGAVAAAAIVAFGEFLPRAFGRCSNVAVALALARPLVGLTVLIAPLRWLVLALSNALLGLAGESSLEREMGSEEELKTLLVASDLEGRLEEDERELIRGVVGFGLTRVGEIITPRPDLCAFSSDTPHDTLLAQMRRCAFHRVLIYDGTLDQIRGVLHAKDLLLNPASDYRSMLRKPLVVPESKRVTDLLREFRRYRVHLAVVCDEFGRTAGVVSMQDLLEEIVGEATEENRGTSETVRQIGPSAWLVPGRTSTFVLRGQLGLDLSEEMGRTISVVVANRLGRMPVVGDSIEEKGFRLTVERMGVRRVALLRVERIADRMPPPPTAPEASDGAGEGHG